MTALGGRKEVMKKQTRIAKTIALMQRGWVTALESAQAGGVLA